MPTSLILQGCWCIESLFEWCSSGRHWEWSGSYRIYHVTACQWGLRHRHSFLLYIPLELECRINNKLLTIIVTQCISQMTILFVVSSLALMAVRLGIGFQLFISDNCMNIPCFSASWITVSSFWRPLLIVVPISLNHVPFMELCEHLEEHSWTIS